MLLSAGTTLVVAKPKYGKSTLVRQLAVSVAEGKPFLGMPAQCADVLFLNLEGPEQVASLHFKALGYTQTLGKIHMFSGSMLGAGEDRFRRLVSTIEQHPAIKLVILDPASRLIRANDNDSYTEINRLTEKLDTIARAKHLQIVSTVHAKKRDTEDVGDAIIGSTAYRGSTDTNIFLTRKGTQRIISAEQRAAIPWIEPTLVNFDADKQVFSLGATVQSIEESGRERQKRATTERIETEMLSALCDGKTLSTKELLDAASGMVARKYEVIEGLLKAGRIQHEKDGRKIGYRIAVIPVEERQAA